MMTRPQKCLRHRKVHIGGDNEFSGENKMEEQKVDKKEMEETERQMKR
jgi:hypothetical protein